MADLWERADLDTSTDSNTSYATIGIGIIIIVIIIIAVITGAAFAYTRYNNSSPSYGGAAIGRSKWEM